MKDEDTCIEFGLDDGGNEFLDSRRDWLRVERIDRGNGGFDVALVIDGTYSPAMNDMLDHWKEQLAAWKAHQHRALCAAHKAEEKAS